MATNIRIGFGIDIHQLLEGRDLFVGGVKIESSKGALGHSDADVLLHAICDALLGAANLRDIGHHFSDTDPDFKGVDSQLLLSESYRMVKEKGYKVVNLDSTILLENPKLNVYIPRMQDVIANKLECDVDQISIKATRGERMGYIGNEEGIQAYATVLLERN
jgi:2-C-methyl-D-erythritol 2,4-cyclodiphosphate synthase